MIFSVDDVWQSQRYFVNALLGFEWRGTPIGLYCCGLIYQKHPKKRPPVSHTLIDNLAYPPHFILFDQLDAVHLHHVALKLHGAAGSSCLDASAWRCMCTSFQIVSDDSCDAL